MNTGFIKGVGVGMAAGAIVTMAMLPVDKRRMMKSPMGRKMKVVCDACEDVKNMMF